MTARGKREARRPWSKPIQTSSPEGRNWLRYRGPSGLILNAVIATRGDALRACPWLSYLAPLAL